MKKPKNAARNLQLQGIKLEGFIKYQNSLGHFQQFSENINLSHAYYKSFLYFKRDWQIVQQRKI
jgi:hypothetical protein